MKHFILALSLGISFFNLEAKAQEDTKIPLSIARKLIDTSFTGQHADYLYPNGDLAEQMKEVLGKTLSMAYLKANLVFIAGCRIESCTETGAIVIDLSKRKILSIGVRHFHCRKQSPADSREETNCDVEPTIDQFSFKRTDKNELGDYSSADEAMNEWKKKIGARVINTHNCRLIKSRAVCD